MGGTLHWRRGHVAAIELRKRATIADRRRCERIIEAWNRRPTHEWSPAIGTAVTAGYRWLSVYCPGCRRSQPSTSNASIDTRSRRSPA